MRSSAGEQVRRIVEATLSYDFAGIRELVFAGDKRTADGHAPIRPGHRRRAEKGQESKISSQRTYGKAKP
jgi:hypothetical protein